MKVKDLPVDTNLTTVKVKLPDDVLRTLQEESTGSAPEMYIVGYFMGNFFLSKDAPSENKCVLCPIMDIIEIATILEWEVVE